MQPTPKKVNVFARQKARRLILQALYQWQMTGDAAFEIIAQFLEDADLRKVDLEYFKTVVAATIAKVDELDASFEPFLDRPRDKLTPIELGILRLASYELLYCLEIPYRVVLNEALELGKKFGTEEGYKYINAVLDKTAEKVRKVEVGHQRHQAASIKTNTTDSASVNTTTKNDDSTGAS